MNKKNYIYLKILATLGFVGVVVVNYLANALPIGGITTGEASDAFANLFTPAGITFSIWGLIYLLLAVYVVYQFGVFGKKINEDLIAKVNVYFIITSIANISWIFAWHHRVIWLSVLLMLALLVSLIKIADILRKKSFTNVEKFCVRLPFSIYFGWITVATIANISVFLVSLSWNGFGLSDQVWTVIVLLVGVGIGIWRMLKDRNIAYGLVIVWAYLGILLKHLSADGWVGQYTSVIVTVIVCLALLLGSGTTLLIRREK